jgi:hypothetical protein
LYSNWFRSTSLSLIEAAGKVIDQQRLRRTPILDCVETIPSQKFESRPQTVEL